jgi:hypothetical protein
MSHLFIDLYDQVCDRLPCCRLDDHEAGRRRYFHDLHHYGAADQVDRVVIRPGDEYRGGDHIRLLDRASPSQADTIVIDPAIIDDVDLNEVLFDDRSFANRAEAVLIVTNPNSDSSYRLRLSLYDRLGQELPSLIFYDWEYSADMPLADLNLYHFANKAEFIRIEKGPAYQAGDRVILRENLVQGSRTYVLEPGEYDLHQFVLTEEPRRARSFIREIRFWADSVAGIELDLQPAIVKS